MWAAVIALWLIAIAVIIASLRNAARMDREAEEAPTLPLPQPEPLVMVVIGDRDGEPTAVVAAATEERAMEITYHELARQGRAIIESEKRRAS